MLEELVNYYQRLHYCMQYTHNAMLRCACAPVRLLFTL